MIRKKNHFGMEEKTFVLEFTASSIECHILEVPLLRFSGTLELVRIQGISLAQLLTHTFVCQPYSKSSLSCLASK